MNKVSIVEVNTEKEINDFIFGIAHIYENHSNWVPTLNTDINSVFDPNKNKLHDKGESKRWLAYDGDKVIGRIGAFYNTEKAKSHEQATGGIGFYECIDDKNVSKALFNTSIKWLKSKGMEAVDGPINFGENFNYWGLLTEGDLQPTYGMQYHPKYYKKQFEDFGFQTYYNQFSFRINPNKVSDRVFKIGSWVNKKNRFTAKHLDYKELDKFSEDISIAFNNIWKSFKKDYTPICGDDIKKMITDAKFVLDPKLVWIIYEQSKPIAFAILIPDVNQLIDKTNGEVSIYNALKMFYYKKTGAINRIRSLAIGVDPQYQKFGVEAFIFYKVREFFNETKYIELEFSWIGDFNLKMLSFIDSLGPKRTSTHTTYRYLFDRNKEYKRYPIG